MHRFMIRMLRACHFTSPLCTARRKSNQKEKQQLKESLKKRLLSHPALDLASDSMKGSCTAVPCHTLPRLTPTYAYIRMLNKKRVAGN